MKLERPRTSKGRSRPKTGRRWRALGYLYAVRDLPKGRLKFVYANLPQVFKHLLNEKAKDKIFAWYSSVLPGVTEPSLFTALNLVQKALSRDFLLFFCCILLFQLPALFCCICWSSLTQSGTLPVSTLVPWRGEGCWRRFQHMLSCAFCLPMDKSCHVVLILNVAGPCLS